MLKTITNSSFILFKDLQFRAHGILTSDDYLHICYLIFEVDMHLEKFKT